MSKERHLIVISGPSGSGKDTVVKRLMELHPEIEVSVSATTREIRPGEKDGVNYVYHLSLWLNVAGEAKVWLNGVEVFAQEAKQTRQYNQYNISEMCIRDSRMGLRTALSF